MTTLAVPVVAGGDLVACLSIRHLQEGAEPAVIGRYPPPLQVARGASARRSPHTEDRRASWARYQ